MLSALCIFLDYFWALPEDSIGEGDSGMGGILITIYQFCMIAALTTIGAGFRVAIESAGEDDESEDEGHEGSGADGGEDEEHESGSEGVSTRLLMLAGLGFYLFFACCWRSSATEMTFFRVPYYLRLAPPLAVAVAVIVISMFRDALVPADDTSLVCIFTTSCLAVTTMWNLGCLAQGSPDLEGAVGGQGQGQDGTANPLADGELQAQLRKLEQEKALLERRLEVCEEDNRRLRATATDAVTICDG